MRLRKLIIAGSVAIGSIVAGTVAYAAWSASGSGTGSALAYTAQTVTVNAVALSNSASSLFPGGPAGNVYFTVTNTNPYPIKITNIAWGTPTSNNPTACPNSMISVDASAPTSGFSLSIPANGTSTATQVNAVLDLSASAPDGCQGNGFSVPMTVTGQQLP